MKIKISFIVGIAIIACAYCFTMGWLEKLKVKAFSDSLDADLHSQIPPHLVKASYVDSLVKAGKLTRFSVDALFPNIAIDINPPSEKKRLYCTPAMNQKKADSIQWEQETKERRAVVAAGQAAIAADARLKHEVHMLYEEMRKDKIAKGTWDPNPHPMMDRGGCVTNYSGIMFQGPGGREVLLGAKDSAQVDSITNAYMKAWEITGDMEPAAVISKIVKHQALLAKELRVDSLVLGKLNPHQAQEPDHLSFDELVKRQKKVPNAK